MNTPFTAWTAATVFTLLMATASTDMPTTETKRPST